MSLGKLRDSFTKLTAKEILTGIAIGKIGGMWLSKRHYKVAEEKYNSITEEEADIILNEFDSERSADYEFWRFTN